MDQKRAKRLGRLLRTRREKAGIGSRELSRLTGINQATIVRLEQGEFLNPDPDKLRQVAEAIGLNLSDVLSLAGYPIPTELPSTGPYLRAKYRDLSDSAVEALTDDVNRLLAEHGIDGSGEPTPGEDEAPESAPPSRPARPRTSATKSSMSKKKGGTR